MVEGICVATINELPSELTKVFDFFNARLFDSKLVCPPHVVQPEKKSVFRFKVNPIRIEIGLGFGDFNDCTSRHILSDYLHQMVHIYNFQNKIVDCSSNQYHNKRFALFAVAVGLFVNKYKNQGWSRTSYISQFESVPSSVVTMNSKEICPSMDSNQKLQNWLEEIMTDIDVNMWTEISHQIRKMRSKAKPCFLKYICKCKPPRNNIRSGRRPTSDGFHPALISCGICGGKFLYSE